MKPVRMAPRRVEVLHKELLSPDLMRLVLTGDLQDYPQPPPAAHFKLLLPKAGQVSPQLPDLSSGKPRWAEPEAKPWVRTYTVRHFNRDTHQLTVDLVLHEHGPASDWAREAVTGSQLAISAPGGPEPMLPAAEHYWLVGDLSALPAIAALLETLPADAKGNVWLLTVEDPAPLLARVPDAMDVHWIQQQTGSSGQLLAHLQQTGWFAELDTTVWVAGEHHDVVAIRKWLRRDCDLDKSRLYAVPYWKKDADEETYHQQRHAVMDEE